MSELIAGVIETPHNEGMSFNRDSTAPVVRVTEGETEFYLKSEADKVIAEKDKEIQRLENLCESYRIDCDNLAIREANACKEIERDNKQIRRQKYKRCVAKAEACMHKRWRTDEGFDYARSTRHMNKWLELAEQFKEAE